jgi:hypothetical protein
MFYIVVCTSQGMMKDQDSKKCNNRVLHKRTVYTVFLPIVSGLASANASAASAVPNPAAPVDLASANTASTAMNALASRFVVTLQLLQYTPEKNIHVCLNPILHMWFKGVNNETEVGKHPDLLVGPPTATVFPTNDRKYKKLQFFEKIFEKI